jgi:hypothetical protein
MHLVEISYLLPSLKGLGLVVVTLFLYILVTPSYACALSKDDGSKDNGGPSIKLPQLHLAEFCLLLLILKLPYISALCLGTAYTGFLCGMFHFAINLFCVYHEFIILSYIHAIMCSNVPIYLFYVLRKRFSMDIELADHNTIQK